MQPSAFEFKKYLIPTGSDTFCCITQHAYSNVIVSCMNDSFCWLLQKITQGIKSITFLLYTPVLYVKPRGVKVLKVYTVDLKLHGRKLSGRPSIPWIHADLAKDRAKWKRKIYLSDSDQLRVCFSHVSTFMFLCFLGVFSLYQIPVKSMQNFQYFLLCCI